MKRNQWSIQKANDNSVEIKREHRKEIKLDTLEQAARQLQQRQKFHHEKKLLLDSPYKESVGLEREMQLKQQKHKYKINF